MSAVLLDLDHTTPLRGRPILVQWLRALGLNPNDVRRVRVLDEGGTTPTVEVVELARDANGNRYLRNDRVAEAPPYSAPLTAAIPDQIATLHAIPE